MQEYRDHTFRETGDLYAETTVHGTGAGRRANSALALAAAFGVLIAGAGVLALAMRVPLAALVDEADAIAAAEPGAPPPSIQALGASAISAPDATPAVASEEILVATRGVAPSLAPATEAEFVEAELAPRVKPAPGAAPRVAAATNTGAPAPDRPIALGAAMLIGAEDGPPPFFALDDLEPAAAPATPISVALGGDMSAEPVVQSVSLARGETFVDALRRAGVRAADRNAAAAAFGAHQNLRLLRPGQEFTLTTAEENRTLFQLASAPADDMHLLALDFRSDAENRISLKRAADGRFEASKSAVPITSRLVSIKGAIDGSLYLSAKRVGAPDEVIAALADMFAYDVDFQREIFGGDEFEAIFEVRYDDKGRAVSAGEILYGRLKWRGRTKEKGYYLFADYVGGRKKGDYFDATGQSAKRLLMKTPIDGARLSSGFGTRRHPILGYAKAHKGVDFAAPTGTPIKAAGDGVVERAGPFGSFGNYIKIRHANGYHTAYAHLNAIKKGVRAGARVDQGEIIGYVGSTGRSTGPHLHYEVHHKGAAVNPQNLKIATGVELQGKELAAFRATRAKIDSMRAPAEPDLVARKTVGASAL